MMDVESEFLWAAVAALGDMHAAPAAATPFVEVEVEPPDEIARLRDALGQERRWHVSQADTCDHVGHRATAYAHRERIAAITHTLGD